MKPPILIARFANARWRRARQLGAALDLLLELGPRHSIERWRDQKRHERQAARDADSSPARMWRDAAAELGAEVADIGNGFLELRLDGATTRVWRNWVMLDDVVTLKLAHDKTTVHRLLAERGIPIPRHTEFDHRDLVSGLAFLDEADDATVVKPASGMGSGSGITSGVRTHDHLRRAVLRAARLDRRILIERQAEGGTYRVLFLDGEFLGGIRQRLPQVTGDGRSTVGELIAAGNRRRIAGRDMIIAIDLDTLLVLENQGMSLRSVPPSGTAVLVKGLSSRNAAEENETVTAELGPELIASARAAVAAVGLRLGSVDLVTSDPTRALQEVDGVVLEVNGTPGLHYHYHVADPGSADRVAIPILARLLQAEGGRGRLVAGRDLNERNAIENL